MYIRVLVIFLILVKVSPSQSQSVIDSLSQLVNMESDSAKVEVILELSKAYRQLDPDSALYFAKEGENMRNNFV